MRRTLNEPVAADQWIYSTLKADSTLTALIGGATSPRIYNEQAPQNGTATVYPCVIYQMQSAVDLQIVGPRRFWTNMLYLVRGVNETGSYSGSLLTIAERIDEVLHAKPDPASNAYGIVWACVSEQAFRLPEVVNGRNFRHSGRIFRIYASKGM
jgi:hypothetical protein